MSFEVKLIPKNDLFSFTELIRLFEIVFEMDNFQIPDQNHLKTVLNSDHFLAIVATDNDKIVGGLTVYKLDQYYSPKPLAYIYDLAVLPEYQRKGIGKLLIAETVQYATIHNYEEVFVQADKVDDYALDFYRSTKPSNEEDVSHFYYLLS